ncbi:hypothetical protein F5Y17DRAFT_427522 [Xylariaceae sp. FL0594]|nr:hypothetical protein F5Y17DRAFT_427522 [Xylariaceae sp. FL0594]
MPIYTTQHAQGVFLWAVLVTASLVKGALAGDDWQTLQKRLDSQPKDINELFKRLLLSVDDVYKESFSAHVQLMLQFQRRGLSNMLTVPLLTILRLPEQGEITSYAEFATECGRTELHIAAQSAGFLEVGNRAPTWERGYHYFLEGHDDIWKGRNALLFVSDAPRFGPGFTDFERRQHVCDGARPAMLKYELRSLRWIHRSAFDFFADGAEELTRLGPRLNWDATLQRIARRYSSYIAAAPSLAVQKGLLASLTFFRLKDLFSILTAWSPDYPARVHSLLDEAHHLYTRFEPLEHIGTSFYVPSLGDSIDMCDGNLRFWTVCFERKTWKYLLERLDRILNPPRSSLLLIHLLCLTYDEDVAYDETVLELRDRLARGLRNCIVEMLGNVGCERVMGPSESPQANSQLCFYLHLPSPRFNSAILQSQGASFSLDFVRRLMRILDGIGNTPQLRTSELLLTLMSDLDFHVGLAGQRHCLIPLISAEDYLILKELNPWKTCSSQVGLQKPIRFVCVDPEADTGYKDTPYKAPQRSQSVILQLSGGAWNKIQSLLEYGFPTPNMKDHALLLSRDITEILRADVSTYKLDENQRAIVDGCVTWPPPLLSDWRRIKRERERETGI